MYAMDNEKCALLDKLKKGLESRNSLETVYKTPGSLPINVSSSWNNYLTICQKLGATSEKIEMHFLKESDGLYRPVFCEVESPLEWPTVAVKYNLDETCDFEHYLQEQLLITGSIFLDNIIGQLNL